MLRSLSVLMLGLLLADAGCASARYPAHPPSGLDDVVSPARALPRGTVQVASFFSPSLGVRKHYEIYLPPSYATDPTRRYPVAYYLHGADGNESDWVSRAAIDWVMDSLIARGVPEMILVMPDGDESWYATSATPADPDTCAQARLNEAADLHCVAHARYDLYIAHDLVGHVDSTYRTLADRRHRAIGGLSMGGYGALVIALGAPDVFSAVVSHSGVVSLLYVGPHPYAPPARYASSSLDTLRVALGTRLWTEMVAILGDDVAAWRAHDPTELARRLKEAGRPVPAIYFDAGREDRLTIDRNRAFDAELSALGVAHEFREWPGTHSWPYWHAHVGEGLAWLGARIGS